MAPERRAFRRNAKSTPSPEAEALRQRTRKPRESAAVAIGLNNRVKKHKIARLAVLAVLAGINSVVVSAFVSGSTSKDISLECLSVEGIFGLILVGWLAFDDMFLYGPRVGNLVSYWQRLATRDSLTGLYNRLAFLQALDRRIAIAKSTRARYGVMFIDLNKFKEINDTFGHAIGDGVLTMAARRISEAVGSEDLVARLGGDEFAILLMRTNVVEARRIEVEITAKFSAPMTIAGQALKVGASIGTCLAGDHHTHAEEVLHNADLLMYRHKAQTRWAGNTRVNGARVQNITRAKAQR